MDLPMAYLLIVHSALFLLNLPRFDASHGEVKRLAEVPWGHGQCRLAALVALAVSGL